MPLVLQTPNFLIACNYYCSLLLSIKGNINNVQPGETAADTEKKRKTVESNNSVVVVGVCLSLVAGIALVCVLVLKRSGSSR